MKANTVTVHALAGKPAPVESLIDVHALRRDYFSTCINPPNRKKPTEYVSFGTSGHRGVSTLGTFNETQILAITQAICEYRQSMGYTGPIFMGKDSHALSEVAEKTALEVLAANEMTVVIQQDNCIAPTPAISREILVYNKGRKSGFADGIVITPSHNPPTDGGFKYNPPDGGPADSDVTKKIQARANAIIANGNKEVKRIPFESALKSPTIQQYDFVLPYVKDLANVIDMQAIKDAKIRIGVDPLGGAAFHYWKPIAEMYGLDLTLTNTTIDPQFAFMTLDHDGKIRMDCSSPYAMAGLVKLKDQYSIAFGNDPDSDRHGIVTPSSGLMNPNHFLSVAIDYLIKHRQGWKTGSKIGKTAVSSSMIDRVVKSLGREVYEVPVGFKYFVKELNDATICFGGEESAGASFHRKDGSVWTTDKDGLILGLLAAEITAVTGKDPGEHYQALTQKFGNPVYTRIDNPSTPDQKDKLLNLSGDSVKAQSLAGEEIKEKLTHAPGNGKSIEGLKVTTQNGWFAARPSGTENIYKLYAESFLGSEHLQKILDEAKELILETIK